MREKGTLLFPATRHDPSNATLIERIGISPAGAYITHRHRSSLWSKSLVIFELHGSFDENYSPTRAYTNSHSDPTVESPPPDHKISIPLDWGELLRRSLVRRSRMFGRGGMS